MSERPIFCPLEAGLITEMMEHSCPCGWPEMPCIKMHEDLRGCVGAEVTKSQHRYDAIPRTTSS